LLFLTGLVIHRPDMFGLFSFRHMVTLHNLLALRVGDQRDAGAVLASSPPARFASSSRGPTASSTRRSSRPSTICRASSAATEHPFEKSYKKKLNPLQQITYFGLLNVLLPLQILTGVLMWGAQQWPQTANMLGGLPYLAPFHTLIAWLLATFVVAHIYLTTTGATSAEDIKAMVTGWENVPVHQAGA
jgi:hypothetical protein